MSMIHVRMLVLWSVVLLFVACNPLAAIPPTTSPEPASESPALSSQTPVALSRELTKRPTRTPIPPTSTIPPATLEAELVATVSAGLSPTSTALSDLPTTGEFEGIGVLPLEVANGGQPLWAVFSTGFSPGAAMDGGEQQRHFVAIYTRNATTWKELDRVNLERTDILPPDGVRQVQIAPGYIWIEVQSGAGAHSGVYDLLSFDREVLRREAQGFSASPGAGMLKDLNNDSIPEVVLDQSDPYVFCYACGVVEINYQVLRWDGNRMVEVGLTALPDSAPSQLQRLINQSIDLATHNLWLEAETLASQADDLNVTSRDAIATWDSALIRLTASRRAEHARTTAYPLLGNLFYGDYTAVIGILSGYEAEELFKHPNPLITGSVAEGFESSLIERIITYTTQAIDIHPDLAEAYFLRGWAHYLDDPAGTAALTDVEEAAALAPGQPLFADSVAYLRQEQPTPLSLNEMEEITTAATAFARSMVGDDQLEPLVEVEKIEGDYARVLLTIPSSSDVPMRVFLKRESGVWKVVVDERTPVPDTDTYERLGIPESMFHDLVDSAPPGPYQEILDAAKAYLRASAPLSDVVFEIWAVDDRYARICAQPISNTTEPLTVYLVQREGQWHGLSFGTDLDPEILQQEGVPASLIYLDTSIEQAVKDYMQTIILGEQEIYTTQIVGVDTGYACVRITFDSPKTSSTTMFLRQHGDEWSVIGYGTTFTPDFLALYGIPESLYAP